MKYGNNINLNARDTTALQANALTMIRELLVTNI